MPKNARLRPEKVPDCISSIAMPSQISASVAIVAVSVSILCLPRGPDHDRTFRPAPVKSLPV